MGRGEEGREWLFSLLWWSQERHPPHCLLFKATVLYRQESLGGWEQTLKKGATHQSPPLQHRPLDAGFLDGMILILFPHSGVLLGEKF